jgi:hypothetical protein
MTNTISQNIRGALEQRLKTVAGLPTIAYEGNEFVPVPGTPFVEAVVVFTSERPASMGDAHMVLHEGLFMVSMVYPNGKGSGDAEAMADAVKTVFKASQSATLNDAIVRFRYAERRPSIHDPSWIRYPVAISWFIYDQRY